MMERCMKILLVLLLVLACSSEASAQRRRTATSKKAVAPILTAEQKAEQERNKKTKWGLTNRELDKFFIDSFMFSGAEAALIQKAMGGRVEKPQQTQETLKIEKKVVIPKRRIIKVSGVLFRSTNDWAVWINGRKITPEQLLPEIIEIKVKNSSYVKLKWYDVGLNKVISIMMRPNQTYDITTGILLPG